MLRPVGKPETKPVPELKDATFSWHDPTRAGRLGIQAFC